MVVAARIEPARLESIQLVTRYLPDCAKPGLTERVGQFVLGINWNNRVFLESCLRIVVVILRKNSVVKDARLADFLAPDWSRAIT